MYRALLGAEESEEGDRGQSGAAGGGGQVRVLEGRFQAGVTHLSHYLPVHMGTAYYKSALPQELLK